MLFSSLTFLLYFLPPVILIHFFLPGKWQNLFLLIASLVFYAWGDVSRLPLFAVLLLSDWGLGRLMQKEHKPIRRKALLTAGLLVNFGALFYYKYAGFFLGLLGADASFARGITLPLGISFFTFQAAGYLIDVYRRDTEAEKSPVSFGAFLFLFPQLIAGPIVRYGDLKASLHIRRRPDAKQLEAGMALFIAGLSSKVLLANPLGAAYEQLRAVEGSMGCAWLSLLAYTLQIYFDFMGYSVMAVGMGRMLGFSFPRNFNQPYAARSVTDFWRRWHMTLSGWFRDYVYIPLGGSRRGRGRTVLNLFIVWLLTGLWHGADWAFVLWGLWYFVWLTLEKFLPWKQSKWPLLLRRGLTLLCVMLGWALFSAGSLPAAAKYVRDLFSFSSASKGLFYARENVVVLALGVLFCVPGFVNRLKSAARKHTALRLIGALALLALCLSSLAESSYNPFLYFRF